MNGVVFMRETLCMAGAGWAVHMTGGLRIVLLPDFVILTLTIVVI